MKTLEIPPLLTGSEIAVFMADLVKEIPVHLGYHLLFSTSILTFAGLKPSTYIFLADPTYEDEFGIDKINSFFDQRGVPIRIRMNEALGVKPDENIVFKKLHIDNLIGFERKSRISTVPGMPEFYAERGFLGLKIWQEDKWEGLEMAQSSGKIPKEYPLHDIDWAVDLGYPDVAIFDYLNAKLFHRQEELIETNIPYTHLYKEPHPNFFYYPWHAQDPVIVQYTQDAGEILRSFYSSPEHRNISENTEFMMVRDTYNS